MCSHIGVSSGPIINTDVHVVAAKVRRRSEALSAMPHAGRRSMHERFMPDREVLPDTVSPKSAFHNPRTACVSEECVPQPM